MLNFFGQNGNRENSLFGAADRNEFTERLNLINDELLEFEHPTKALNLSEWFIKYKFSKIYNKFWKLSKGHWPMVHDYYTTNDIEGNMR